MTVSDILAGCQFIALRYEGRHIECTGITAVAKQEQRVFHGRGGVMVLPWCPRMASAKAALEKKLVVDSGLSFEVAVDPDHPVKVRVLIAEARDLAPILYLAADGFFEGVESPYDTPDLNRDALFLGLAVKGLLANRLSKRAWIWGADWQTVPALLLAHSVHHTAITLHNTFDCYLGNELAQFSELRFATFRARTALQVALETFDVVTTVNRGYAYGLKHEVFHSRIMAEHLQFGVDRIVGIDNANFVDPSPDQLALADLLERDPKVGLTRLNDLQKAAFVAFPPDLARRAAGKVLCIAMGRRSSQKLHDVVVEAVREALRRESRLPMFTFFATTHSDASSPARLARIQRLCQEFPDNCGWSDGRVPFFSQLMAGGSYNLLCSLWAPHEAAFEATIVPIARAVDGLAAQVVPLIRSGLAGDLAAMWHPHFAPPSGLTFRETPGDRYETDLRELLEQSPSPENETFRRMTAALSQTLRDATHLRIDQPEVYAKMVLGAVRQQSVRSWLINFGGMLSLVEAARSRRHV
jgi:Starch synthase catalytic domain